MNTLYNTQISSFYADLIKQLKPAEKEAVAIVVAHMVPNALSFLPALNQYIKVVKVLPKPKSVDREEYKILNQQFSFQNLSREWAASSDQVLEFLDQNGLSGKRIVLVDIGGYFSNSINDISSQYSGEIVGVLEGTENGVQKYEKSNTLSKAMTPPPIITVARSPLKLPEDYLVASGVVFSIEAVLRQEASEIIETRRACVIGYGRVGSSIAHILRARGIATDVFDTDPVKLAEAAARGFVAHTSVESAIDQKTLIVCATGNHSMSLNEFLKLKNGCCVASVTSSDDEFDLSNVDEHYKSTDLSVNLTKLENMEKKASFLLLANGNAANFVHGAVIGPAMQLIEGEKIAAVKSLIDGEFVRLKSASDGLYELSEKERKLVASTWNKHFL